LSASTRILSGKPPRAMWSAAVLLGLYRIMASLAATADCPMSLQRLFTPSDGSKRCSDGQPYRVSLTHNGAIRSCRTNTPKSSQDFRVADGVS
jgi:hypothetical protein